jgi:outer membrane protein W
MKCILAAVLAAAIAAAVSAAPASAKSSVNHQRSVRLFNMVPQGKGSINSDDPSLTGGGSIGYNQNIYNW